MQSLDARYAKSLSFPVAPSASHKKIDNVANVSKIAIFSASGLVAVWRNMPANKFSDEFESKTTAGTTKSKHIAAFLGAMSPLPDLNTDRRVRPYGAASFKAYTHLRRYNP